VKNWKGWNNVEWWVQSFNDLGTIGCSPTRSLGSRTEGTPQSHSHYRSSSSSPCFSRIFHGHRFHIFLHHNVTMAMFLGSLNALSRRPNENEHRPPSPRKAGKKPIGKSMKIATHWIPIQYWLVVSTPLKNMKVSGMIIPNIWKNKKCSKPPTRVIHGWNSWKV